jgi:ABC-type glycerol-3-phosphate transport system substrate-binding protein
MKRITFLAAAVLFLAVLSSGCFKSSNGNVVRVAIFSTDPAILQILNQTIRNIQDRHPGLRVVMDSIPYNDFEEKIVTQVVAGSAPDIVSTEASQFVDLYLRDVFVDLTPYFQKDGLDVKDYYPAIMRRFSPGGKIYAVPSDLAPTGLVYYNKKFFDEAQLPYPTAKWSWPKDFLAVCQKLVKKDAAGNITRFAFVDPYGINAVNFVLSNGGYFTDSADHPTRMTLDSPEAMQAFRFRWDLIYTYHVSPTMSELQNFAFGSGAENMFMNGQTAMMGSGVWHTPHFLQKKDLDFDVVEFPHGPSGKQGWQCGGSGYAISKDCKNMDNAWIVLKELTSAEVASQIAATGMIQPALVKVAGSDAFLKSPGAAHKKILLDMPKNAYFTPFVKNWSEIWNGQISPGLDPAWMGMKKPEDILPKLTADVNRKYFGVN